jgi:hypothetical protein
MIWDPKTKLVSPQLHVVFDDNFETVQPSNPEIKMDDTMDRLFKTNNNKYDDHFGIEHTYLFCYGEVDINPNSLCPDIKTCHESIHTASTADEPSIISETTSIDSTSTRSILSIQDMQILQARNIFPQKRKDDLNAYKHLHGIDMQMHSIPKTPNQKIHDMSLLDLHEEEFKLFTMECNNLDTRPSNELEYYVNTL